jgi:hypothetical protein
MQDKLIDGLKPLSAFVDRAATTDRQHFRWRRWTERDSPLIGRESDAG